MYLPLNDLSPNKTAHLYGVVTDVHWPKQTSKDWLVTLTITDPSLYDRQDQGPRTFSINVFFKDSACFPPCPGIGSIVRCNSLFIQMHQYRLQGLKGPTSQICYFAPSTGPLSSADALHALVFGNPSDSVRAPISAEDVARVESLSSWAGSRADPWGTFVLAQDERQRSLTLDVAVAAQCDIPKIDLLVVFFRHCAGNGGSASGFLCHDGSADCQVRIEYGPAQERFFALEPMTPIRLRNVSFFWHMGSPAVVVRAISSFAYLPLYSSVPRPAVVANHEGKGSDIEDPSAVFRHSEREAGAVPAVNAQPAAAAPNLSSTPEPASIQLTSSTRTAETPVVVRTIVGWGHRSPISKIADVVSSSASVPSKFKVDAVVKGCWPEKEEQWFTDGLFVFSLRLQDSTGQLNAILYDKDAEVFLGVSYQEFVAWTAQQRLIFLRKRHRWLKLSLNTNHFCVFSFTTPDKSILYRIFATHLWLDTGTGQPPLPLRSQQQTPSRG